MARGRFLNRKIVSDYRLNNVPVGAELLYYKMITFLDRDGRILGNPKVINRTLYSLREFSDEQIDAWLNDLESQKKNGTGLIVRYEVDKNQYIYMPGFFREQGLTWFKYVRPKEAPSDYPPPPSWAEPTIGDLFPEESGRRRGVEVG